MLREMDRLNVTLQQKKVGWREFDAELTQILDLLHFKSGLMNEIPKFTPNSELVVGRAYKEGDPDPVRFGL